MAIQAQLWSDNFGFSLGESQNLMEDSFGFNIPQNLQQKTQNPCVKNSGLLYNSNNHQAMAFSQSISIQLEKQRQEIDRFISLQNERLRLALQEQRKQQIALLLRKCEAKAEVLLKQKDEELAKAMNRRLELEEFMRTIETENQTWQRVAKEYEVMVASLSNTIEQIRENPCFPNGVEEDVESCCDVIDREDETGENIGLREVRENPEQRTRKMVCRSCNFRSSCVVFLPCRHICSCKDCHAFLNSCPACGMVKKAIIEALF